MMKLRVWVILFFSLHKLLMCSSQTENDCVLLKARHRSKASILVVSMPKSGTHLMGKLIECFGFKRQGLKIETFLRIKFENLKKLQANQFELSHLIASEENMNTALECHTKMIYIYRDPRDQIVSLAYYMKEVAGSPWVDAILPLSDLISKLINDYSSLYYTHKSSGWNDPILQNIGTIQDFYNLYRGWLGYKDIYVTSFEKLVGSKGGGDDVIQLQEIEAIAQHCGLCLSKKDIVGIQHNLFGSSTTFRSGQIGAWKKHFTLHDKQAFKQAAGQLLIDLGYEQDFNW